MWGACKGEVERLNVQTGQAQGRWIYPQDRYGHHPDEIKFRFPRQTVIMLSPHDPKIVYQASHVLHRSTDDGVTWQVISPDLTAHEKEYQVVPGRPITRDVTGEEVYSTIYSMAESPIERGVIWVGANDGPGARHARQRQDLEERHAAGPAAGRPRAEHRRIADPAGSAYIAVYRFLREHDLKPYIYRTDDYGATWTKLTDGTNGIPADHPTRVVREDPERAGLLYAGTEFGMFVSFDNGRRWQRLQQNLPATPVTDLRVHRGDLVIATMGRSFWIMDDIAPLRQMAAAARRFTRLRDAGDRIVTAAPAEPDAPGTGAGSSATLCPAVDPRALPSRRGGGRGTAPQYPPVALAFDYVRPRRLRGPVSLAITDATGRVVRTIQAGAAGGRGQRGGRGGRRSRRSGDAAAAAAAAVARASLTTRPGSQPIPVGLPLGRRRAARRRRASTGTARTRRRRRRRRVSSSSCRSTRACSRTA